MVKVSNWGQVRFGHLGQKFQNVPIPNWTPLF